MPEGHELRGNGPGQQARGLTDGAMLTDVAVVVRTVLGSHFGVFGPPPISEPLLVWIGMVHLGVWDFGPWPMAMSIGRMSATLHFLGTSCHLFFLQGIPARTGPQVVDDSFLVFGS